MGKYKKNKPKREKKEPIYRTKEERQAEVKKIISTLSDLKLDPTYEPIKILYKHLNEYVNKGERIKINIPFHKFGLIDKWLYLSSNYFYVEIRFNSLD